MASTRELLAPSPAPCGWSVGSREEEVSENSNAAGNAGGCPVAHGARVHPTQGNADHEWWPNKLNLKPLAKNTAERGRLEAELDYAEAFISLDLAAVKADITAALADPENRWPVEHGHQGGLMIQMAWHAASNYRGHDGRGGAVAGQQRFTPLSSWPDNEDFDKARRLLWPLKQKYGQKISWADLMILAGNVALESMGVKTVGFAGGRSDVWEPDDAYRGTEKVWLDEERCADDRDPLAVAVDVQENFRRVGMDDQETVALLVGGHTFGNAHGAHPDDKVRPDPEAGSLEALDFGPTYELIALRLLENPDEFADVFARAWFKLTHRGMGPKARYLGSEVPAEDLIWQDPLPAQSAATDDVSIAKAKAAIVESGLTVQQLVSTAYKASATYRTSDRRGGANGGRIRLEPQVSWKVNQPEWLTPVIAKLEEIASVSGLSFSDTLVLAGGVGVEEAATAVGTEITVGFTPGRVDAAQEQTSEEDFAWLEPVADGFRNYDIGVLELPSERLLVDRADLLGLTAAEMTVLVGGLRVLGNNWDGSDVGVFTDRPGTLTNDFFVNLLEPGLEWTVSADEQTFTTTDGRWTGSRVDLLFGSNSELRALAEVYASDDAREKFVADFATAWTKVMELDRFDLA